MMMSLIKSYQLLVLVLAPDLMLLALDKSLDKTEKMATKIKCAT